METYIKTVLESLKEDNLTELREFLERELTLCWKEAEKEGKRFAEWVSNNDWQYDFINKYWWAYTPEYTTRTTPELMGIFLIEKQKQ